MRHRRVTKHVSDVIHVLLVMSLVITAFAPIFSKYFDNTAAAQDAALTTGTFGYTSDGGSAYDIADRYAGSQYTFAGTTGSRATNITLWLEGWGAGEDVMCTIFEWNGDKANLARTVIRDDGGGTGWHTFELISPLILTNGKTYALMARTGGTVNVGRTGSGYTQNIFRVATIFENPELTAWSSWDANTSGYNVSIYCSYVAFDDTGVSPSSWYSNPWRSCKKILIRKESIEATLTNYPLLIKVVSDDLKVGPQSDADDFLFVLNSSGSKLNHEIEYFDLTSGTLFAWVNVTSLSSTADTILWMYYNNSGAGNQEAIADTWDDDYIAVFHLDETFSTGSGTYYDSTGSGNTGKGIEADGGGNPAVMLTDRGYCTNFSGVDDAIMVENKLNYNAPFSVEAWVKSDDSVNGWDNKNDNPVARYYGADGIRESTVGSGRCAAQYTYNGTSRYTGTTAGYAQFPYWYYMHSEITTSDITAVLKGLFTKSFQTSTAHAGETNNLNYSASYYFAMGASSTWSSTGISAQFNGSVDEVRFSTAARSAAYKNTTFRSMYDPDNFIFVFDEVSGGAPANNPPALSSPSPANAASNQDPEPTLAITVNDAQGNTMNITWFESPDNSVWTQVQQNQSIANGTYRHEYTNASSTSNTYYWAVNASDGTDYTNTSYSFSLKGDFYQKWKIDNNLYTGGMVAWAVAEDVTGDGIMEIFFVGICNDTNAPGQNVVICLNGSTGATEWYNTINTSATDLSHSVGTLADLDMDGTMEYVHGGGYNTFAWNAENGTEFWNSTTNSAWSGHTVVYDERVDHCWIYQTTISSYSDNKIWRINGTTGVQDVSSTNDHGQSCNGGIAHWDIDRDGEFEIVATGSTGGGTANGIKVYDLDLNLKYSLPWWQQTSHTPILEDIDGDGEMEIISAENDGGSTCDGELHIYNADGTLYDHSVPNWGAHDECVVWENTTGNWLMNSRRGSNYGEQYCLIWNLTSDTLEINWTDDSEYGIPYKCDIYPHNGDDYEILYPSAWSDNAGTVYYMENYTEIIEVTNMWSGSPIITDLDGDGYNEGVFIQSNGVATCFDFGTEVRGQGVNTWTEQAGPRRTNSWDHYETPIVYQARFTGQSPADNATGVSTSTASFNVTIKDPRGNTFNWTIATSPDVGDSSGNTASNGSKSCTLTGLVNETVYTVYVNVSDTLSDGYTRWQVYNFTTQDTTVTWQIISNTIGDGTLAADPITWQIVSNTIGDGTLAADPTTWQIVSDTIGDGTLSDVIAWEIVSNTIGDGTLGYATTWQVVSNTIGDGTLAANPTTWQIVSNTIGDGTLGDALTWQVVSNTIGDGTLGGATTWQIVSNTIGDGTLAAAPTTWQIVSDTIGDGTLGATPTTWQIVSNTIGDGTLAAITTWQIVSNTIGDGTLGYITTWQTVSDTIGDGVLAAAPTTWQIISSAIGDGVLAADPTTWQIVTDTIGDGVLANPAELLIHDPFPANNSTGNALALTWNVTIDSIVGPFNWSINCSNGASNNASTDTNGSKTLVLTALNGSATYIVWVNTSAAGYWKNETFNFTTWVETVVGTFTYVVQGTEIIVTPSFGHGVEQYMWKIRNSVSGTTQWIDIEDASSHTFTVKWGSTYRVTLIVYGDGLTRESSQMIKIRRDPEYTYNATTGERIDTFVAVPEGDSSPYTNIFGAEGPSDVHLFAFVIALAICITFLVRDRKRLYMLVGTRRKKDEREGKEKRKGPKQ